ncbi:MAG: S8 family serine peptidase [Actinomycetota bacterium]|nr:S8 family serine peptidase [Actinomycetota bacterium]
MNGKRFGMLLAVTGLVGVGVMTPAAAQTTPVPAAAPAKAAGAFVSPSVLRALQGAEKGAAADVRVVVSFDTRTGRSGTLSVTDVSTARASVLASLPAGSYEVVSTFQRIPSVSLKVTQASLDALSHNPLVHSINIDQVVTTYMNEANTLTGVASVHSGGITGEGATVAIIDTGVDSNTGVVHPALADDLAGQACFRTENDCIGGPTSAEDQDGHGTHVAGMITGPQGVAPDARFYALKVFTTSDTSDTNILNALDHVISLNTTTPGTIDLINMSLGGDNFADQATCDANGAAYLAAFTTLNAQGVTIFVATGNDAQINQIGSPGCITGAVGVGSTGDNTFTIAFSSCTDEAAPDKVSCYSNTTAVQGPGELTDLLAPGCLIVSTGLDGATDAESCGTSMATPYAVGAAALLVEYLADNVLSMTPAQIEAHMETTGVPVSDYRLPVGSPTFPRVSPPAMIGALAIEAPSNFQITGTTATSVATSWTGSSGATEYHVYAAADGAPEYLAGTVVAPNTTFTDNSAMCGTLTYHVKAFNGSFESIASNTDTDTARPCPLTPGTLSVSVVDADTHDLNWTDSNPDETSNVLQRSVNGAAFADYQALAAGTSLTYTDDAVACGVYQYRAIAVRNGDRSAPSNVAQRAVCAPANDDFANAETVTADVPSTDTEPNDSYATEEATDPPYSCHFGGSGPGFQGVWYDITPAAPTRVTVSTAGTTIFAPSAGVPDTLVAIFTGAAGSLTEVACNDDISGSNFRSTVSSNLAAGTTYHVFVSQWVELPIATVGNLVTAFTWSAPIVVPDNDLVQDARVVSSGTYTNTVTSAQNATTSATDLAHSCAFNGAGTGIAPRIGTHTLWWTYTPAVDGTVDLDTLSSSGSFTDTIMTVYTGTSGAFTEVACNDDEESVGSSLRSEILDLAVAGGTTYTVYVSRWSTTPTATAGTVVLDVVFAAAPAVVVAPTTVAVTEGGATDTYSLVLATAPTADVEVSVSGDADCSADVPLLTFTTANWMDAQTVTVSAVDDLLAEGTHSCTITHAAASGDPLYGGIAVADVNGTVTDRVLVPAVTITKTAVASSLPEPGGVFTFNLLIHNQSAVAVTIDSLTDDDTLSAACTALVGTSLTADDSAPGGADEATCTSSAVHTEAGSYQTTASVGVSNAFDETDSASDNETVSVTDLAPVASVEVTANPTSVPETGGLVTFTLVVTNQSVEPVTISSLSDSDLTLGAVCGDAVGTTLGLGGTYLCAFTSNVSGSYASGVPHVNTVTVAVTDNDAGTASFSDDATVNFTEVVVVAPTTTVPRNRPLPATGQDSSRLVALAGGLVVAGLVLTARRRGRGAAAPG